MPTGTSAMPTKRISLSRERIISDFFAPGFFWASRESWAAKESPPTAVNCTRPRPERMAEPDLTSSPGTFVTASASPVSSDSSTHISPLRKMPSAGRVSPEANSAISSLTMASGETSCRVPLRMTATGRSATSVSRSTARLARISWMMPMTVLITATTRKPMFRGLEPPMMSITARTTKIRLKKVKQWVRTISFSLLPE